MPRPDGRGEGSVVCLVPTVDVRDEENTRLENCSLSCWMHSSVTSDPVMTC